jgi:hypothetical protein
MVFFILPSVANSLPRNLRDSRCVMSMRPYHMRTPVYYNDIFTPAPEEARAVTIFGARWQERTSFTL